MLGVLAKYGARAQLRWRRVPSLVSVMPTRIAKQMIMSKPGLTGRTQTTHMDRKSFQHARVDALVHKNVVA